MVKLRRLEDFPAGLSNSLPRWNDILLSTGISMVRRIGRWMARALLGAFVVWQLAFLLGLNFCEVSRHYLATFKEELADTFPNLVDEEAPAARRLAKLEQVCARWSELTYQIQNWSLFAPNVWSNIPFVAVEFRWDGEPANAPAAVTAPRSPVYFLSDNEPPDIHHYFRLGRFRLRRYESNLDVPLATDPDKTDEDMQDKWRSSIRRRVKAEAAAMRAYLEWRWRDYQAAHPDIEIPQQVILHVRVYRIPPPSDSPWTWEGPVDRPMARWRPDFDYPPEAMPVEVYDLVAERYDVLP